MVEKELLPGVSGQRSIQEIGDDNNNAVRERNKARKNQQYDDVEKEKMDWISFILYSNHKRLQYF